MTNGPPEGHIDAPTVLLLGPARPTVRTSLVPAFHLYEASSRAKCRALVAKIGKNVDALGVTSSSFRVDADLMSILPGLRIVAIDGVRYGHVDVEWARTHGIVVTNTPIALKEELADDALGLLLYVIQKAAGARRGSMQGRSAGIVGLDSVGQAIAKRLEAMSVPIVYSGRRWSRSPYLHYTNVVEMAHDVDTLLVASQSKDIGNNLITTEILKALGPKRVLISVGDQGAIDEDALITSVRNRTILGAGLNLYRVDASRLRRLAEIEQITVLPQVCSSSTRVRNLTDGLMVSNLLAWAAGKPLRTPVPETSTCTTFH